MYNGDRNLLKESTEIINNFINEPQVSLDKKQLLFTLTTDMNKFITVTWQLLAELLNIAAIVLFLHMLLFCQHTSVYRQVTRFPAPFLLFIQCIQSDSEWWRLLYGSLKIKVENFRCTGCIKKRKIRTLQKRIARAPLVGKTQIIWHSYQEVNGTQVRQRALLC